MHNTELVYGAAHHMQSDKEGLEAMYIIILPFAIMCFVSSSPVSYFAH